MIVLRGDGRLARFLVNDFIILQSLPLLAESLILVLFFCKSRPLLLHTADETNCTVEQTKYKCADEKENGKVEKHSAYRSATIIVILTVRP